MLSFDCVIVGTGPAGLGAAFRLLEAEPSLKVILLDKSSMSSGGLKHDCKMNFTYPVGFPLELWEKEEAEGYLDDVEKHLKPKILEKKNISVYAKRAEKLGVQLLDIRQAHLGTDRGSELINRLVKELRGLGAEVALNEEVLDISADQHTLLTKKRGIKYGKLILAPGRQGFRFLQLMMDHLGIRYMDHIVDIGVRIETKEERYPIVRDYYDPKFLFPDKVRTFCTNSGRAHVVKERYLSDTGETYYSVNGHALSEAKQDNGLANFAMLKTVRFTEPLASGQEFAKMLGLQAVHMGGGNPIMQRIGDFRLGKRSKKDTFDEDPYDFEASLPECTPGDISLSMPAKILRGIWKSLKMLDTIVPGIMHPSTIMYYPELKLYGNKPVFMDDSFQVNQDIYMIGDGAGTSRGITAAWASGIRAARGILCR
ncbi:MAG TPA: FAD-dependent oxidoreductase [Spirochaetia bacterium]|nr:FAD-dependent oxidoreductase [Spirochaetia bacterium]